MDVIYYSYDKLEIVNNLNRINLNYKLTDFLDDQCLKNGSSLKGRIDSFNYINKTKQKTPILISLNKRLFLIPLWSIYQNECTLVNYFNIKQIINVDNKKTKVIFHNGLNIEFDINVRVINKQIKRVKDYLLHLELDNRNTNFIMNFA